MVRKSSEERARNATGYERLCAMIGEQASNLYSWGMKHDDTAIEVRFKCRGSGDWLGIAKRYDADGKPQVLFGSAFDFVSCVLAVSASMSANKWREDKPWSPE